MTPLDYHIADLLRKYFLNDIDIIETEALKKWVTESEENQIFFNQLKGSETIQAGVDFLSELDYTEGWQAVRKKKRLQGIKKILPYFSAAAVLLIVMAVGLYFRRSYSSENAMLINTFANSKEFQPTSGVTQVKLSDGRIVNLNKKRVQIDEANGIVITGSSGELVYNTAAESTDLLFNTIMVPKKGFFKLTLSDGTNVWLNSYSQFNYPVSFPKEQRRVKLSGEAYFEVSKDPSRPFLVEVSGKSIQVLGTRFNVNAYQSVVKATLLEGSVKVILSNKTELLVPGQEAMFSNDEITLKPADIEKDMAWKKGEFFFRKATINEIMNEIAAWYDIDILYHGNDYEQKFSGNIRRSLTLPEVLDMLHFLSGYQFKLTGKTVSVFNQSTK